MDKRGWTVKQFADEIGKSPEHARKLRNGTTFPSQDLTQRIADRLQIDAEKFRQQVDGDKCEQKFGRKPPEMEPPDLGPLTRIWSRLDPDERESLVCIANCLVTKRLRKRA
jgi:transcriptional regulator with XRE-family HTH domain